MVRRALPVKPTPGSPEEDALLRRLEEALSDKELRRVLAVALLVLNDGARNRLIARLGPEMGTALGAVLKPPRQSDRKRPTAPVAGKGRIRQEWDRLWDQWRAVVEETSDEQGKYVEQEAHWEPPYLDTDAISKDLDAIASRMRPLIGRVIAEGIDPGFSFTDAIEELDGDLGAGLPEWIEPGGGEGYRLGPEATLSLLEWEWTLAQRDQRDASAFLDDIRDLEIRSTNVGFDYPSIKKFILGLSEQHLRVVLESMTRQRSSKRWTDAFTGAYGCWAEILRELSKRWNPTLYAETSRANISQDWTLALPLVQGAVKRKAFDEASTLIEEALRSLLRLDQNKRWDCREQLLIHRGLSYYGEDQNTKLATLLRLWQETAQAQEHGDVAVALAVQITALREAENGAVMLEAFGAVPPQFRKVHDALFSDWRTWIVERTLQSWSGGSKVPCGGWVTALVDAARVGPEGTAAFQAAVRATLEEARSESVIKPRSMNRYARPLLGQDSSPLLALAVLTHDLDATASTLKQSAPKLLKLLSSSAGGERGRVDATRRAWCARLGGASLLSEVLAFWRDNAVRFVPDPGGMADYAQSADWLAAVNEINPTAAGELLARWGETHRLKRNLWRDLAQRGFTMPTEVRTPTGSFPTKRRPRRSGQ